MRLALLIAGIALMLVGAVWIGQGTGYFPYPAASFMINDHRGHAAVLSLFDAAIAAVQA